MNIIEKGVINLKKVLVFFITLLLILSFTACSTEKAEQPSDSQPNSSYEDVSNDENSNEDIEVKSSDAGIPIPKGYPEDLVPIIEGSRIFAGGSENLDNEKASAWIKILSTGEVEEVAAFYRDVLSDAIEKQDQKLGDTYFLVGTLEGMEITMKISSQTFRDGYPTTTLIEIAGIDSIEDEQVR